MTFTSTTDLRKVENPDLPETKTFNPTPQGMAYAMAGRATARVCRGLQIVAYALAGLSCGFVLWVAALAAADAPTLILLGLFGILCVLAVTFLPAVCAHLHEPDATLARLAWMFILAVYALGAVWLVMQPAHGARWLSFGAQSPERALQLAAIAGVVSTMLGGTLNRFSVLASLSAYRLWEGVGVPTAPATVPVTLPELDAPAGMTPEQLFKSWFLSNVRLNIDSEMRSRDALESYRATAAKLGYPAMSDTGFFKLLAAEAAATGGRVFSGKSGGMLWHGWALEPFKVAEIAGASPLPDRPE